MELGKAVDFEADEYRCFSNIIAHIFMNVRLGLVYYSLS
jgi:hypothetical protein